jgi:class 3 adenylate cyclase
MRQNYFLAVCDILGFSALVGKNSLESVVELLAWFRRSLNHSVLKSEFPDVVPATSDLARHEHVGVAWFSDTLLFYTKSDTDDAIRELLATVAWLVFEGMVDGRTRVRAGIAYGEAYIDPQNSLFVGKPIVEAYRLERAQQWSGGALSQSACDRLPEKILSADWWVVQYDVPLKDGKTHRTLALNWNTGIHLPGWRLRWSAQSDVPSEADWAKDRSVCEKFVNTKRFHEAYCDDCHRGAET